MGSPKAVSASRIAAASASGSASGVSTRRMPRPPPPATAFTKMGNPMPAACASSSSGSAEGSVEASVGIPARFAAFSAATLFPASSRISARGPTNVMPSRSAARARSGFSDRNP